MGLCRDNGKWRLLYYDFVVLVGYIGLMDKKWKLLPTKVYFF